MARAFESVIRLQLDKYGPEAAKRKHIEVARRGLAQVLAKDQSKPLVTIETDGRPAATEENVKPFGIITYRFSRMREIAAAGKALWVRSSPEQSGDYKRSVAIFSNKAEVEETAVPNDAAEVIIVATVPYARKIHTRGAKRKNVPAGIAERVVQAIRKQYGSIVTVELDFISLSDGYKIKRPRGKKPSQRVVTYPAALIKRKF